VKNAKGIPTHTEFFCAELYAYDEYDSWGSGQYFTDDVFMCGRYICPEAEKSAREKGLKIFLVTITKKNGEHKIEVAEI
jgi:hypothetical protein